MTVAVFAREVAGRAVVTRIDNEGSVVMARKGYDVKCAVTSCLIRTTHEVAAGLGTEVYAEKVPRCSSLGPVVADMLSKGRVEEMKRLWPVEEGREQEAREVPKPLEYWLQNPRDDPELGKQILKFWRRNRLGVILWE